MKQVRLTKSHRTLDLPKYSLSEKKNNIKSCFINHNRIDTIKPNAHIKANNT